MILRFGISFRAFSTSLIGCSAKKEARVMNKLLKVSSKNRSWYTNNEVPASSLPQQFISHKGQRNFRRIAVLNKLFMKYISDIISTGEISSELADLRLEISKVKISQDFGILNVYWITKGTNIDKEIETILTKNAGKIKHELTQLRVVGNVPAIQFVKDMSLSKLAEVDTLLAKADYGEDFEPTDPTLTLISEFTLSSKLPPEIQEKILNEDGNVDEDPLPPMAVNVLGLDHDVIMQKLLRSINKSHASHRFLKQVPCENLKGGILEVKHIESAEKDNEEDVSVQHSELKKFVAKRMALHRKLYKEPRNHAWENDLICDKHELPEEDNNDKFEKSEYDVLRVKELECDFDDFDEIVEKIDSSFYKR